MLTQAIVLGIDLGTSFSSACAYVDGRPHLVTDARGDDCIPSVVYFPRHGPPVVGVEADRMRSVDPTNTVSGIKRLLGCTATTSGAARLVNAIAPYKLVDKGDGVSVSVRTGTYHPAEIAGIIFKHLRDRAELRFGQGIRRAVLTHPVAATPLAIQATVTAAKIAGLEVIRTISEPAAGALAAGVGPSPEERRFAVFDFGGGTLDVTVMEQRGHEFRVLASGGDDLLGGDDFDRVMAERIADAIWRARGVDVRHDVLQWDALHRRCELAKRALSSELGARIHLELPARAGAAMDLVVERDSMEPTWKPLVDRALAVAAEAMVTAGLKPRNLAGIVPIGGTTYIPLVRRSLDRVFPVTRFNVPNPQTIVAAGAAMVGVGVVALAA